MPTINSIIVSLTFIKLVHSIATTDLRSKKTTRYSYKRCHNFEEYCIWIGQATKEEVCKSNSTFFALKRFIWDDELGDDEPIQFLLLLSKVLSKKKS